MVSPPPSTLSGPLLGSSHPRLLLDQPRPPTPPPPHPSPSPTTTTTTPHTHTQPELHPAPHPRQEDEKLAWESYCNRWTGAHPACPPSLPPPASSPKALFPAWGRVYSSALYAQLCAHPLAHHPRCSPALSPPFTPPPHITPTPPHPTPSFTLLISKGYLRTVETMRTRLMASEWELGQRPIALQT